MVARLEHVAHAVEEAVDVRLEDVVLLGPEEAEHRRARQVERAVALAVDALPRPLPWPRRSGATPRALQQRAAAAVGPVALALSTREPLVGAGQVEGDRLDRDRPAHLLVELEVADRLGAVDQSDQALRRRRAVAATLIAERAHMIWRSPVGAERRSSSAASNHVCASLSRTSSGT